VKRLVISGLTGGGYGVPGRVTDSGLFAPHAYADRREQAAEDALRHLRQWPDVEIVEVRLGDELVCRRRRNEKSLRPVNARLAALAPDRRVGDRVEVRWHLNGTNRGGQNRAMWKDAVIAKVFHDRSVLIADGGRFAWAKSGYPTVYAREDVRAPSKRQTTGKSRGRGAPGGWV